jgi:hypothetical protein
MVQTTRFVIYERDEHGSPYAVEIVEAERWHHSLLEPPPAEQADVRVVWLRRRDESVPRELPGWLAVEVRERRAAEASAPYTAASDVARTAGGALWPWSPHRREPGASLAEFLSAGASAVRHPDPSPADARRQLELLSDFAQARPPPLAQVSALRADALERWLHYAFGKPERFAEALLLERIADAAPAEVQEALRFLAGADVPDDKPEYSELAIDRRVLREQASPWRFFEGAPFAGALSAVQAWRRRYRLAYDTHYHSVLVRARELRDELEATRPAASSLERLDCVGALGPPAGEQALAAYEASVAALEALPAEPDPQLPCTAGVTLAQDPAVCAEAKEAVEEVRRALEVQRQRLASSAVRLVLEREGVPALDRLLQAIAASDVEGIERVLDERLAAHIDRLLTDATDSPLSRLAARHPTVTGATLDEAVADFRELLVASIAAAEGGRAVLREDRATLSSTPPT